MIASDTVLPPAPEYHDYVTLGTYLIGTIVITVGGVIVAWINRGVKREGKRQVAEVKKALDDHPTSNGFTKDVKDELQAIAKSMGAMHGRLDHFEKLAIGFDDRITTIEDEGKVDHEEQSCSSSD